MNDYSRSDLFFHRGNMNERQQYACEQVLRGKNVLVTGGAGTGKTFFLRKLIERLRQGTHVVGVTSMTGTSALLIQGTTLHAYLGIGIAKDTKSMMMRVRKFRKRKVWEETDILIIDEVSMLSKSLFESLDYIGKEFRRNPRPFGGMQVVMCGDFCQLGCIDSDEFCFESTLWSKYMYETIEFDVVYRQQKDPVYAKILDKIRFGEIDDEVRQVLTPRVRKYVKNDVDEDGIEPTKLYPYRKDVAAINQSHLQKLIEEDGEPSYEYRVRCSERRETVEKMMGDRARIRLCRNAQVILTVNLDMEAGLVNGSRGVILGFDFGLPIVRFVNGIVRTMEYYTYTMDEDGKKSSTYTQMPLILGWAITIHKSQGMTLDCVVTELLNVFDYGQGYVTLSRVQRLCDIYIAKIDFSKLKCNPKVYAFYKALREPPSSSNA